MYKVLIVDDEIIFRNYLRTQVKWEENDFMICGEAVDGMNALQLTELVKPDIVIADINMPNMDGITLSWELKEKYKDIGIILITGCDELEYARKAIKIGVEDYFVKPFIESELLSALKRVKEKIIKYRMILEEQQNNLLELRERALNILLEGWEHANNKDIYKQLERLDIRLKGNQFIVAVIEIHNLFQRWNDVNNIMDDKNTVINTVNNKFKANYNQIAFIGPENRIISIVSFQDECEAESFRPDLYKAVSSFLHNNFDIVVTIGIGNVVEGLAIIRDSYMNSLYTIRNKPHHVVGEVILYTETKAGSKNMRFYPSVVNEKLTMYLRLNDYDHLQEELDNIFNHSDIIEQNMEYNYAIFMGLKAVCMSYITEMNENLNDVLGDEFSPMHIVDKKVPIEEARNIVNEMFVRTINYFMNGKLTRTRKVAEMAKDYIDLHYDDKELSLVEIAKNLFLNYDYVRRSFKKEFNITLTEYITSVRMEKVRKLLGNGNKKLSTICYEVGINDASYFSKCFKKYYGLSPREYENIAK